MKKRAGLCLGVAALLILAVLVGAAQRDASQPVPGQLGGRAAPLMGLEWIKGGPVQLTPGSITVVEFWATWCPPCRTSIPHLTEIQHRFKDQRVTIVGVSNETADIVKPFGITAEVAYTRGVPPVVNEFAATERLRRAVAVSVGEQALATTAQSLGGEDFAWYVETMPGAMGRLGTRTPHGPNYDLHQGNLRIDERAIAVGAKVLAHAALV